MATETNIKETAVEIPKPLASKSSSRRGAGYVLTFLLFANANAVLSGNLLQDIHPFTFLFWSFFISAGFFGVILVARNGLAALKVERASAVQLFILNVTTAFNWIAYFYALHLIEPAIVNAMLGGLGPLVTIVLERFLRKRRFPRQVYVPATGVLFGAGILGWASLTGKSGLAEISVMASVVGLLAAAVGGVSQALNTVATKQLTGQEWSASRIMTHRFYLLLIIAAGFSLVGPGLSVGSSSQAGLVAVATVIGVIVPLWLLQRGIILSEPFAVSAQLALAPILTYLLQGFDSRMNWSVLSATGCVVIAISTIYCTRIVHKGKVA